MQEIKSLYNLIKEEYRAVRSYNIDRKWEEYARNRYEHTLITEPNDVTLIRVIRETYEEQADSFAKAKQYLFEIRCELLKYIADLPEIR